MDIFKFIDALVIDEIVSDENLLETSFYFKDVLEIL
jgi:hypothetical protein